MDDRTKIDVAIVTPVLNDWESLAELVNHIHIQPALQGKTCHILAVDDGSTTIQAPNLNFETGCIKGIDIVRLNANQGHQRAIAIGLAHLHQNHDATHIIVMDSDGEDRPEDIGLLLSACSDPDVHAVVAQRKRRSEGFMFTLFYQVYKFLFTMLTGKLISFGNYSVIRGDALPRALFNSAIWNNYAATLIKSRMNIAYVQTDRGTRYFGSSKMNFTSLMLHGLSCISVFTDIVIGRLILFVFVSILFASVGIVAVLAIKLMTDAFVPGYATTVILFLVNILFIALFMGGLMVLLLLSGRDRAASVPTVLSPILIRETVSVPSTDISQEDAENPIGLLV